MDAGAEGEADTPGALNERVLPENRYCGKHQKQDNRDYVLPLSDGGSSFDHLMSLRDSCQSRIHADRGDRWHGRTQDKSPADLRAGEGEAYV